MDFVADGARCACVRHRKKHRATDHRRGTRYRDRAMRVRIGKMHGQGRIKNAKIDAVGGSANECVIGIEVDAPNPGDLPIFLRLQFDGDDRDWIPSLIARLQSMQPAQPPTASGITVATIAALGSRVTTKPCDNPDCTQCEP